MYKYCLISYIIFFLFSCENIKYQPIVTPKEKYDLRKKEIESQLQSDFNKKNIIYKSIYFGQESIVKPKSYFILDSLYQLKYNLEKEGKSNKILENQITIARNNTKSDTTQLYFIEHHVFSCTENDVKNVYYSEITCDKNNKLLTLNIKENHEIPSELEYYFAKWIFNESFIHYNYAIDENEIEFYQFYRDRLNIIKEVEKEKFLIHALELMKIADEINSLEISQLIAMCITKHFFGNTLQSNEIIFENIEENSDSLGNINHYLVEIIKSKSSINKKFILKLNPYLQIIEESEKWATF